MPNEISTLHSALPVSNSTKEEIRVGKLDTIESVRNELAKLYRAARKAAGPSPNAATASRLGFLLMQIGKIIESTEFERRLSEVEDKIKIYEKS